MDRAFYLEDKMSNTVARRIPIGPCQVYVNDVRIGSPGSSAVLNYSYDVVTGTTGDNVAEVSARKTNERGTVQIEVSDLKTSQLRYAWEQAKSIYTLSLMTSHYLASTSVTMRKGPLQLALTGSGLTDGLVSAPDTFTSASVVVYSQDYETEYTQDTDFSTNTTCDGIFRTTGGSISSGDYVQIHYNASLTASYIRAGGADALVEDDIKLVIIDAAGKMAQLRCWRAVREGDMNLTLNHKDGYPGMTLTYRLLANTSSYIKGSQLFEFSVQT